ncbi:MAG TPA: hypothetical protein VKY65_06705 [Alphaproteobacteria bacterium]|nr:hypothetical protein [Alphaproteobacteria bacterium]
MEKILTVKMRAPAGKAGLVMRRGGSRPARTCRHHLHSLIPFSRDNAEAEPPPASPSCA